MPETYVLLGQIRAQRGNFKGAEEMFTKAAEVESLASCPPIWRPATFTFSPRT
jgi:hypothetical protein